jgi:hypothetical protein
MDLPGRYLLALLLTVAIEAAVAWLFGFRAARSQLAVAMINCITNPSLNFLLLVLAWLGAAVTLPLVLFLEVMVVLVEWRLLVYVFGNPKGRLFSLSLAAIAVSFLAGAWLF